MKNSFTYTDFFYRSTLYFALAVALTAMLGSLYFSEVRHYLPCNLCWYQRILMYPLVLVLAVGLLRQDFNLPYYVLPLSLLGQIIATYHYLLEKTNIFAAPTTCQEGIPCTTPWINWGGFITIPFLSMTGFFLITVFCLIAMTNGEPSLDDHTATPWVQVGLVIAIVVIAFVLINRFDPLANTTLSLTIPATGEMTPVDGTPPPTVQLSQAVTTSSTITTTNPQADPDAIALGQQLYSVTCAPCHGVDALGTPNLGPSLAESLIVQGQTPAEALAFIRAGHPASADSKSGIPMPPSGGNPNLTDDDILAIISYLHAQ